MGILVYVAEPTDSQPMKAERVTDNQWACEPALWVSRWTHRGSLRAALASCVFTVNGEALHQVSQDECHCTFPGSYARAFVEQINSVILDGGFVDDLFSGFNVNDLAQIVIQQER